MITVIVQDASGNQYTWQQPADAITSVTDSDGNTWTMQTPDEPVTDQTQSAPIEEFGCHQPHCKATRVPDRIPWQCNIIHVTDCDCGLAKAVGAEMRRLGIQVILA